MLSLVLVFCSTLNGECQEVVVPRQPDSLMECQLGGQFAAAEWLKDHPMMRRDWVFDSYKCVLEGNTHGA